MAASPRSKAAPPSSTAGDSPITLHAFVYMLLLALQFAFQPVLNRTFLPDQVIRTTPVILGEVPCGRGNRQEQELWSAMCHGREERVIILGTRKQINTRAGWIRGGDQSTYMLTRAHTRGETESNSMPLTLTPPRFRLCQGLQVRCQRFYAGGHWRGADRVALMDTMGCVSCAHVPNAHNHSPGWAVPTASMQIRCKWRPFRHLSMPSKICSS